MPEIEGMKNPPAFTEAQVLDLESALAEESEDWARLRLETLLTVAKEGQSLSVEEITDKHEISKATLYRWLERFRMNEVGALLYRTYRRSEYSASRARRKFEIRVIRSGRVRARLDVQRRKEAGEDSPWMRMFGEL